MPSNFIDHLEKASKIVSTWPEWKQNILGGSPNMSPVHSFVVGDYVIYNRSMWGQVIALAGSYYLDIKPICSTQTYKKYKNASIKRAYYHKLRPMTRGSVYAAQTHVSKMASNLAQLENDLITSGALKS